ncbi:MAG: helix-turn-helix transcriptional regulator [Butyrivibrio sp.]|uniref:helix-turn-helix domain-containing protein n=1 Tax=Butyrivibrio sp. TaxID=28121 RepID=UPI001B7CA5E7|nr:helix-turn-helix transcriptional regulator [Butyrivibrio sp.]MBP3782632.1 helix-turn-helix transcriptional regulator [Butyrivibrio sp.]
MAYSYSYYVDELRRKIKRYRIESGISQQKLSELTGVSVRSLQRFEKGSDISFENLMKILVALNIADLVNAAIPDMDNRPSAKLEKSRNHTRQRARKSTKQDSMGTVEFKWGDET